MTDWNHILNWRLLEGAHRFPGPAGGSCVNEVAVVVSGFEYRQVNSVADLPECFCPFLSNLAIMSNDAFESDELRTLMLMPFVTKLAGTRSTMEVLELRIDRILRKLFTERLLPLLQRESGWLTRTKRTTARRAKLLKELLAAPKPILNSLIEDVEFLDLHGLSCVSYVASVASAIADGRDDNVARAAHSLHQGTSTLFSDAEMVAGYITYLLAEALKIGPSGEVEPEVAVERLQRIKENA